MGAVEQATAEIGAAVAAPEAESPGVVPPPSDEEGWNSDGELEDTDPTGEPGYGVVDMRNAHQVMILTQVVPCAVSNFRII